MTTPPFLKQDDKVGIVSPAKRTTPQEIEYGLNMLEDWGLIPVQGTNVFNENFFLAGTDEERAEDLQAMLDDPEIKAIFFSKGGYGTLRIIDRLDFTKFRENPKWIVGYSDITVLHSHIHNFAIATLHSVMLQGMETCTPEAAESTRKALFGESLKYKIPISPENKNIPDVIRGQLIGGNLSVLYALIGSESDIDMDGKILFIEDIDEYRYHIDRMFLSFKRAGKLKNLKAIIVGDMTYIKDSTIPYGQDERVIMVMHTKDYDFPLYFDFPAGHTINNMALVLGSQLTISMENTVINFQFL